MSTDMKTLKDNLKKIIEHIDDKNDVIFLDFPFHHNIGDLLIFYGTLYFFKENSINAKAYLPTQSSNIQHVRKYISKKTTIIFHGGGNFGDIYDLHQNTREKIINEFSENKIIILPQTAFFNKNKNKNKSKNIFKKHKNITMFARDKETYELFKEFSNSVYLIPDMAHQLYGKLPRNKKGKSTLYFLRKDIEINPVQLKIQENLKNSDYLDWDNLITKKDQNILRMTNRIIKINKLLNLKILDILVFKIWHSHTEKLVFKMSKLFSSYDNIKTSRLHGHILSCLVDVPSTIIDNSYGKNTAYYRVWTKDLGITSIFNR